MKFLLTTLLAIALACVTQFSSAQTPRSINVNGMALNVSQIAWFDRERCGITPSGSYWWNPHDGAWGYAGNPQTQGYIGDACRKSAGRTANHPLQTRKTAYTQ